MLKINQFKFRFNPTFLFIVGCIGFQYPSIIRKGIRKFLSSEQIIYNELNP